MAGNEQYNYKQGTTRGRKDEEINVEIIILRSNNNTTSVTKRKTIIKKCRKTRHLRSKDGRSFRTRSRDDILFIRILYSLECICRQ
jgi:hypothetical protein